MSIQSGAPAVLLILDGWGIAPDGKGNAVNLARTPVLDRLFETCPNTQLQCSGRAVGLPDGFMGNSEVGHTNIGAGRVVYQDMTRIDIAIEKDELAATKGLSRLMDKVKASSGRIHYMGLLSDGGVHSHINHLFSLLEVAKDAGIKEVYVHAFMDGRDTSPTRGKDYMRQLVDKMTEIGIGQVASVSGRYYSMDRDKHYERNELSYKALVLGEGEVIADPVKGIEAAYEAGETDEFIKPRLVDGVDGLLKDGDGVFFFNFRADRARQLCRLLTYKDFDDFERPKVPQFCGFVTMTRYEADFPFDISFEPQNIINPIGEVISKEGLKQLRIAETEKYAHVTYFMNGGREEPFPQEDRLLVPSPREVATYDLKPQMSAEEVTAKLIDALPEYSLCICNLANLDMVGHSGVIPAAIKACETVDKCVGRIVEAVNKLGGAIFLTADHGNAEEMIDADGGPQTAHSLNNVPLVFIGEPFKDVTPVKGALCDIAPTILNLMDISVPAEMTGKNLLES
ncbi:2,3-bisphosphoglycerate-independent phosphoglycerate mutase [Maridesulfovibrio hydrothermalis]|uniref:2,3-bisphosphoglycerate-independent phosphoglycerate mutase n=1 Tax=Maridesulfovibrio hydrothermalis AM13 = DSM 14728 TaxID=1121451 RepID=L0RCW9_9BACT|nr:2,3-bisphosphoglycerate-independent phosphoglycerate mutase [Maridesulfovibrio hydrothermalis]CCO24599.1 2,3-bisphosphoglycerate-independent phosphoglycerate mutase [Maridesulfovibrio hydrothermalis AM13 = DSM 14728]